ncbi:UNVERIFIED_CONTAM: Fasciclin-like arabinogalactan protein 7 [Sesamum latifolium]|uniref:Fasciclin-like arabinogalactan protein 7 n=1 Tax=Sesamum latifolium TaxID=2727402 RepID=A0AAW2TK18_9LAMI
MELTTMNLMACGALVLLFFTSANAQIPSPSPAPAPAPDYVNLTDLLSVAGPFHTFLNYLQSTKDQIKSLCLFHALPHYYTLADFRNLSQQNPIQTFAGGSYVLNFTDNSGTVRLDSGWTKTKVISAVHATDPVAIYETDKVLLPEAIFGTDIPPTPAPSPAPEIAPAADSPDDRGKSSDSSSPTSAPSSSHRILFKLSHLIMSLIIGSYYILFW